MSKIKKIIPSAAKILLFVLLFLCIYDYTGDALRGSSLSNAVPILAEQPDESYDVIFAGSSHMQLAVHPAQLFAQYGIASCNTASASQSVPTSYYVIKEMIKRHSPELVVLDLFAINGGEKYFAESWVHEALDGLPLSPTKVEAINSLLEEGREAFYLPYTFYHGRWKQLEEKDYNYSLKVIEKYQFSADLISSQPEPFTPLEPEKLSELPPVVEEYLEKLIDLCEDTQTKLLLTVAPYRADADIHENVSAAELQGRYNSVARLAEEHGVDYLNTLWYLEEMDFDFTEDLADRVHLNALGSEKVSEFYGKYLSENYELPDRSRDSRFEDWHEDCREYMQALEEHKALCLQAKK